MADLWRYFWIRKTGTGQQVVQLHDRYMMMMMMVIKVQIFGTIVNKPVLHYAVCKGNLNFINAVL